jgi:bifunctional protein TilS/HprT
LPTGNQRTYYRAVRRVTTQLNSEATSAQVLDALIRNTARAMQSGASLLLLDSTRKKLIHHHSWGVPKAYLQKGVLDADRSLGEVATKEPVVITDVITDSRIQYPELAAKSGIVSVLAVPLIIHGIAAGSIRIYTRQHIEFSKQDINFVTTMANLAATAITKATLPQERGRAATPEGEDERTVLRTARAVKYAHKSEEEFSRILDFYNIEWAYEPRAFPLRWEGDRVVEMFTPDFYLPGLDLYVELTTLKQRLVTEKNRKLRRLRELYPDIKITLLYKKDYDRLLAKYGHGPLAQARGRGVSQVLYSSAEIQLRVRALAEQISRDYAKLRPVMVGVLRGVFCFMADLVRQMSVPVEVEFMAISYYNESDATVKVTKDMDLSIAGRHVIMVEDIVDTGLTLNYMLTYLKARDPASLKVCALLDKRARRIIDVPLDYVGFEVPDKFVVGYGLDYREEYRNLPFIGFLESEKVPRKVASAGKILKKEPSR